MLPDSDGDKPDFEFEDDGTIDVDGYLWTKGGGHL
jgi:hypothetical protein